MGWKVVIVGEWVSGSDCPLDYMVEDGEKLVLLGWGQGVPKSAAKRRRADVKVMKPA